MNSPEAAAGAAADIPTDIDGALALLRAIFPNWHISYDEGRRVWLAMRKGGWAEYRGQHGQQLPVTMEADTARWLRAYLSSWEATWNAQRVRWAKAGVDFPGGPESARAR